MRVIEQFMNGGDFELLYHANVLDWVDATFLSYSKRNRMWTAGKFSVAYLQERKTTELNRKSFVAHWIYDRRNRMAFSFMYTQIDNEALKNAEYRLTNCIDVPIATKSIGCTEAMACAECRSGELHDLAAKLRFLFEKSIQNRHKYWKKPSQNLSSRRSISFDGRKKVDIFREAFFEIHDVLRSRDGLSDVRKIEAKQLS